MTLSACCCVYTNTVEWFWLRTTGSHHPGSFHAGLLFHWPLSANVVFAMMCRVRRFGVLVDNAAQGGPVVVVIVGTISSPGTRGGLSSDTKYVDNTPGQVKECRETKEGKGSDQVERRRVRLLHSMLSGPMVVLATSSRSPRVAGKGGQTS